MKEVIVRYVDNSYGNAVGEIVGELVRCGECKYHAEDGWGYGLCERTYVDYLRTAENDFCPYGERKSDEIDRR